MGQGGYGLVCAGLVACAVALGVAACEKKAPPPPPPPPPVVTPPPDPVSFDAILREMNADRRVTIAQDVTITDESFARSSVRLASALATGDESAFASLLTRSGQRVLNELSSSGQWGQATSGLESVRVVYAAPPGSASVERTQTEEALRAAAQTQLDELVDQLRTQGVQADEIARRRLAREAELNAENARRVASSEVQVFGAGTVPEQVLLLAVQDAQGAYLLGWSAARAGEGWIFSPAPTRPQERARAAEWDGVGPRGFSLGLGARADEVGARTGLNPAAAVLETFERLRDVSLFVQFSAVAELLPGASIDAILSQLPPETGQVARAKFESGRQKLSAEPLTNAEVAEIVNSREVLSLLRAVGRSRDDLIAAVAKVTGKSVEEIQGQAGPAPAAPSNQ
ncbi:MAG: hypothetical protein C0475_02520 [Planctomyces sp.]|nr:hypothetical protein [Planctomyces sp.]MBA4039512.1 hypothetical protein [Planctomyces sp.]MBA4120754.1 hypothetical protein [Isosphaera sp.]